MPEQEYRPHPSAIKFHESHAQVKALCGPVGSGKSSIAGWEWFFLCTESEIPMRGVVIRESYRQLHDSTRRTLEEWFGHCSHYHKGNETLTFTIPNYKGDVLEHELDFRHCRRAEEASNFLSTEYGFIWLEEPVPAYQAEGGVIGAGLPRGLFDMILMRQRQKGAHRLEVVQTFNPPPNFHWVHEEFFRPTSEELDRKGYALFRQPAFENAAHLPPAYYEQLIDRLGEDMARRFVLGEVVTLYPGQRVFTECSELAHFVEGLQPMPNVPLVISFDFGLTPVALISQTLPNAAFRVYKEVQMFSAGVERLAETLKEVLKMEFPAHKAWRCWGDPAGAQRAQTDERTCYQVLAQHGFNVMPGAEAFQERFEAVNQRLGRFVDGKPALLIDRQRCPLLSEGMLGGYRYPKSHDGHVGGRVLKNRFSHSCESLQYACSGEFSVTTGDSKQAIQPTQRPRFNPFAHARQQGRGGWMSH